MHKLTEKHQAAWLVVREIEQQLTQAVIKQYAIEKKAYSDVFGVTDGSGNNYDTSPDYYDVNADSEVEAWKDGVWGGENYVVWYRKLSDNADDPEKLYDEYFKQFTAQKEEAGREAKEAREKQRTQLLAQLAALDKEGK